MFSPIHVQKRSQQQQSRTPQPSSSSKNSRTSSSVPPLQDLRSPVSVSSLAVRRLRQLVKDQNSINNGDDHSTDENAGKDHKLSSKRQQQRFVQSSSSPAPENNIESSDESNTTSIAADLSALMGGAPVPRVFLHMMTRSNNRNNQEQQQQNEPEETQIHNHNNISSIVSPIRATKNHNSKLRKFTPESLERELHSRIVHDQRHHNNMNNNSSSTNHDEEDDLLLLLQRFPKTSSSEAASSIHSSSPEMTPLNVVMHCREIGHKLAETMSSGSGKNNSSAKTLLKRIIEVLINYGQEQQHQNDELRAKITHFQNQLYEFKEARKEIEEKKRQDEVKRQERRKVASLEGLQEKYDKLFHHQKNEVVDSSNQQENEDTPDDTEVAAIEAEEERTLSEEAKSRKKMIKQIVAMQGELSVEKETVQQLEKANEELKKRLDDQMELQNKRNDEQRQLLLKSSENQDDMSQRYNDKIAENNALKKEIVDLEKELDDKIWVGTIEVESTGVAMTMLRKHCKDTETRTALTTMRLRQEQELVTKLKRKLNEMSTVFNNCLKEVIQIREEVAHQNQDQHQEEEQGDSKSPVSSPPSSPTSNATNNSPNARGPKSYSNEHQQQQSTENGDHTNNNNKISQPPGALQSQSSSSFSIVDTVVASLQQASKQIEEVVNSTTNPTGQLSGGGIPISTITTPRPDKDGIVRSVPTLGKAQAEASTTALCDALVAIIKAQDERLKVESRSWLEAQNEADKVLDKRKNRSFVSVECQTS